MVKKIAKKQSQRDYLKLTAFSLLAITIAVEFYLWWQPHDILNMISTSAATIGFAFLLPAIAGLGIFWLLMLFDAWRANKIIWSLFILFGPGIVALLYFLVEKPKLSRSTLRALAWGFMVIYLLLWLPFTISDLQNRINPFDPSKLEPTGRQVTAKVVTKDLKGYQYKGRTICREMTLDDKYYLQLSGGKVLMPKDRSLGLNYIVSVTSKEGDNSELGSGWESFEGQPTKSVAPSDLLGGYSEIDKGLTGCRIGLWSTTE